MVKLALVIGQGEVGTPLFEMLADAYGPDEVLCRDIKDPEWQHRFKYLHICYPQDVNWGAGIIRYLRLYRPDAVIIHSTLHPGSTKWLNESIDPKFYYSPVRGNIKDGMRWCLENYTKYIAGPSVDTLGELLGTGDILKHLQNAKFKVKWVSDTGTLEYAKILDLCWYGLNIAFYQELERICSLEKLDYASIKNFIETTPIESQGKAQRSVFYGGFIGGHCVIPAFDKLLAAHEVSMIRDAWLSNVRREREVLEGKVCPPVHPLP